MSTSKPWRSWFRLGALIFHGRSARLSLGKPCGWASTSASAKTATPSASWSSLDKRLSVHTATLKPRTRHAKHRHSLSFGPEKRPEPVEYQLGSLLDYPIADAGDQP